MSVNTYINGQLYRVGGIAYYKAGQSIQVNVMPEASASLINRVYQYIGATTENYTHGFFYECVLEDDTYSWQILDTNPEMESISNSNLANIWSSDKSVVSVEQLNVNSNGTYNAPNGVAYNPVVVDVQEEAWEPLEDGYSNFWFELTNDTLSPWLNFSAKNNDAVIDWGDGSGEVALDTLTPTHTYSKAGKYVVKVKGVTGINALVYGTTNSLYFYTLKNAELNSEVTTLANGAFRFCTGLINVAITSAINTVGSYAFHLAVNLKKVWGTTAALGTYMFQYAASLSDITFSANISTIPTNCLYWCVSLMRITIPASISTINGSSFDGCSALSEIHVLPTNPPSLGTNVFRFLPSNFVIYVPVGYGETYKAAAGWSSYADHIVEES